jgi:hypothetical protein
LLFDVFKQISILVQVFLNDGVIITLVCEAVKGKKQVFCICFNVQQPESRNPTNIGHFWDAVDDCISIFEDIRHMNRGDQVFIDGIVVFFNRDASNHILYMFI